MRSWVGWAILVAVAIFVAFVALFWRIGLFDIPETDPGAKAFAAVLGLLGVALTELIAFVALMLKHSLDERTTTLADEAEDRLRMETALKAVGLMGTPEGKEAAASQKAGALMALADLGSVDFSLALLSLIWPTEPEFPAEAAVRVIDRGLQEENDRTQADAAVLLMINADRVSDSAPGVSWPSSWTFAWHEDASLSVRQTMVEATGLALIAMLSQDEIDSGSVTSFVVQLTLVLERDETPRIRAAAAHLLVSLAPLYDGVPFLFGPDGDINLAEVLRTAEEEKRQGQKTGRYDTYSIDMADRLVALVSSMPSFTEQGWP